MTGRVLQRFHQEHLDIRLHPRIHTLVENTVLNIPHRLQDTWPKTLCKKTTSNKEKEESHCLGQAIHTGNDTGHIKQYSREGVLSSAEPKLESGFDLNFL
mmetsp:Transcript_23468/g.79900  ORF Transcript_23468/g.79900 Transcript_23468/m.79900 type:complete len:100 (-) Transcript_23468:958-1257(-)